MIHHMGPWGFFPYGLFGSLAGLLFLAGLTLLIVWLVRGSAGSSGMSRTVTPSGTPPPAPLRDTPLDILSRRFAAGEINAEEYQKARDLLQQSSGQ
ncbi:MAG: SHOCT domain-containing protein [Candidatus Dormibacterales bacterium]